ncbi:hypothetical protein ACFWIX_08275 [Pseudarthrobacter sp. NPDC058362]|uniref:hypothetical protein n=1 Tax=Pseudarthrobacter sp. NPDC058362 TaxID=3346458 RepID=UPI00364A1749
MLTDQGIIEFVEDTGVHRSDERPTDADEDVAHHEFLDRRTAVHLREEDQADDQQVDKERDQRLPGDGLEQAVPAGDPLSALPPASSPVMPSAISCWWPLGAPVYGYAGDGLVEPYERVNAFSN